MNILSIGNSFSQDAQRYLHQIAKANNVTLNVFDLCIGGCPLSRHYRNMLSEEEAYTLEMNGVSTGFTISLKKALLSRNWDLITVQQVSHESPQYETYQPYLDKLAEYIRTCVPKAKIAVHQTWAYEQNSKRLNEELGYKEHTEMFNDIEKAYKNAAKDIKADFIIPSGELFQRMIEAGIEKIHRDTFHASYGIGRYALGMLWYSKITGNDISGNTFCSFDEEISEEEITITKKCVSELVNNN